MKLAPHIQVTTKLPEHITSLLWECVNLVNLDDPASLTKEEAFYDACNRYDAETQFFHSGQNFYSGVLPSKELAELKKPFHEWLFANFYPEHTIYRSQVVRNVPGMVVNPHIDPRLYHKLSHRVHAVLKTNDKARHVYFDESSGYDMMFMQMDAGWLYDFDNITPHAAFNLGTTDRIHIITDVISNADLVKYGALMRGNSNYIASGVFDEYYRHLNAINARYGGKPGVRAAYQAHLDAGGPVIPLSFPV